MDNINRETAISETINRIHYRVFKAVLNSGVPIDQVAARAGMTQSKVENILLGFRKNVTLREMSKIFTAIENDVSFSLSPEGDIPSKYGFAPHPDPITTPRLSAEMMRLIV
jgi:transcriptional regulator with XRE-family HTH domain